MKRRKNNEIKIGDIVSLRYKLDRDAFGTKGIVIDINNIIEWPYRIYVFKTKRCIIMLEDELIKEDLKSN